MVQMNTQLHIQIELVSSYLEDGLLNLLIAPTDHASSLRWYVRVHPRSRRIVDCWMMNSGETIEELPFAPTAADLATFRRLAKSA